MLLDLVDVLAPERVQVILLNAAEINRALENVGCGGSAHARGVRAASR